MGDVLRAYPTGQPASASTLLHPHLKAGSLDQRESKNVSRDTEPTHWKPAVISSQLGALMNKETKS